MELKYTYGSISRLSKFIKKRYEVKMLPSMIECMFEDTDVLTEFVREGAELKTKEEAECFIDKAMQEGKDIKEIQESVLEGFINANFYKIELQMLLNQMREPVEKQMSEKM